ncbi:hypothetical protein LguiA_015989 [Lonicera macranthoides]
MMRFGIYYFLYFGKEIRFLTVKVLKREMKCQLKERGGNNNHDAVDSSQEKAALFQRIIILVCKISMQHKI